MATSINDYNVNSIIQKVKSVRDLVNPLSDEFEVKYGIYVDGENRMLSVFVDVKAAYLKLDDVRISKKSLQAVLSRTEKQDIEREIKYSAYIERMNKESKY